MKMQIRLYNEEITKIMEERFKRLGSLYKKPQFTVMVDQYSSISITIEEAKENEPTDES